MADLIEIEAQAPAAKPYLRRGMESPLHEALSDTPVVCLLGPRQCGKSTLAAHLAPERAYITLDDTAYLDAARADPQGFVNSLPERVTIDEIQRVPELTLAIKRSVDLNRAPGRFLLTGSANLLQMPRLAESLAGRMEVLQLQVFSASELAQTPGSFLDLCLSGGLEPEVRGGPLPDPSALATRLITGGYPEASHRTPARAAHWLRQYAAALIERDIHDIAQVADAEQVARLLTLLAHRNGSLLNLSSLAKELGHTRPSLDRWLGLLERLFLIRRLPAWHGSPGKRLIKSPKLYLRDCGLAAALAQVSADDWLRERPTFGLLLEAFVLQQIVSQAGWTRPDIGLWHYRDKDQVEVDCVISVGRRVWGAEIKLKQSVGRADTKGLTRLAALCGDDFAGGIVFYDGTDVLPLGQPRLLAVPLARLWDR